MELGQFITNETGKAVCTDGTQNNPPATNNSGQCEQLSSLWSIQGHGVTLPLVVGAVNLWNNPAVQKLGYTQVAPADMQPGDIVVFDASTLINSPKYGHTDIYVKAIAGGYQGFDSNWGGVYNAAGYPTAHLVNHTFSDVLGGLRYNGGTMDNSKPTSTQVGEEFQALAGRQPRQDELDLFVGLNWFDGQKQYLYPGVQTLRDTITNLENDRDTHLYPFIEQVTQALGLTDSATAAECVTAINKLKQGGVASVVVNGVTYVPKA